MKKLRFLHFLAVFLLITACGQQSSAVPEPSNAEIDMARMMGISVEELRNQTPEEHMRMMQDMMHGTTPRTDRRGFLPGANIDISPLPAALPTQTHVVSHGDTIRLTPMFVRKNIGGKEFIMYGYNGQVPGPLLRASQGTQFNVVVENSIDMDTTVHWHGLRLANGFDGVPGITQETILPGGFFAYTVTVPDDGIYWYHPHVREDIQQDMGLYGNILVDPEDQSAYGPAHLDDVLMLDDLLLQDGDLVSYGAQESNTHGNADANYSLMGRFGNLLLVNGEPEYRRTVPRESVVRFFVTNVANTRTFRLGIPGARIKLVGADIGRYERETWVDSVTLAPAERAIVDVFFPAAGEYPLLHASPVREAVLGYITVTDTPASPRYADVFSTLRTFTDVSEDVARYAEYMDRPVDKELAISIDMHGGMGGMNHAGMSHTQDGIEWEDSMPHMNAMMRGDDLDWNLIDTHTGKKNMDIHWQFQKGDVVKVRLINEKNSAHPMQHPIHFHGQRFLVLSVDGVPTDNFAWKDTTLVPAGSTTDILLDMSNPGTWMFHCHIAEHLTDGMMGMFTVSP